jgi:hypothetical protein
MILAHLVVVAALEKFTPRPWRPASIVIDLQPASRQLALPSGSHPANSRFLHDLERGQERSSSIRRNLDVLPFPADGLSPIETLPP